MRSQTLTTLTNLFLKIFLWVRKNFEVQPNTHIQKYQASQVKFHCKKYKLFDVTKFISVLPTFPWYNSLCQGLDVEWKVYILFQKSLSNGTKENHMLQD